MRALSWLRLGRRHDGEAERAVDELLAAEGEKLCRAQRAAEQSGATADRMVGYRREGYVERIAATYRGQS